MSRARGGAAGAVLLVVALAAAAVVARRSEWAGLAYEPGTIAESDFQLHWAAGQALVDGADPYDAATVNAIGAATGRAFTPFCAANPLVVRCFGLAPPDDLRGAYGAWRDANVALLVAAAVLLALALRRSGVDAGCAPGGAVALALAVATLALNDGTWQAFYYNQTNAVTLVAVFGALLAGQSGRLRTEGVLLAVAVVAKTSPALLLVVAALAGRRRTLAAGALALVAFGLISLAWNGAPVHFGYLDMLRTHLGYAAQVGPGEFNNSLHDWNMAPNGLLSRAAAAAGWAAPWARAGAWGATLLVLALLAGAVRPRARQAGTSGGRVTGARDGSPASGVDGAPDRGAFELMGLYALGLAAGFLTSSVTWAPHLSLAALPVAWLALSCAREPPGGARLGRAAVLLAVCAVLYVPLGTFAEDVHQVLDVRLKTAACVALFALVLTARGHEAARARAVVSDARGSGARGAAAQRT